VAGVDRYLLFDREHMTHTKDEALRLALEALESIHPKEYWNKAITAIKQALAAPVQEPVGYVAENGVVDWNVCAPPILTDLYTTPPAQPVVPDAFGTREGEHPQYIQGWNDCRQTMLEILKARGNT
jgi:hypothetical protein